MVLGKKEFCTAVIVIAAVLMAATALLASPAWTQTLTVEKDDNPDPADVGESLLYTLEVTNNTDQPQDLVIVDELPAEVDFIAVESSEFCEETSGVVTCEINDLDPGETATVFIYVEPQEEGLIENIAQVFFANDSSTPIDEATEETLVEDDGTIDDRDQTNVCRNVVNIITRDVQNPDVDVNNEQAVSGSVSGDISNEQVVDIAQELNISPVIVQQCIQQNVGRDALIDDDDNNGSDNNNDDDDNINNDEDGDTGDLESRTPEPTLSTIA